MKIKQKKYKGFTLVELIVVIAIFGILATVSVFGYLGFIEKARLSNDEQLVSQINNLIKAEDTYTYGTSNDYLQIQSILKEQGISEVKTQSKGNYIFFNNDSRKAVLASLTDTGINVVFGEDSSSNSTYSKLSTQSVNANFNINTLGTKATSNTTKENGQFLDYIYAPESFVKGYTLITTESRDGFCQKVNNIRKAEKREIIVESYTSIQKNYSQTVGDLLEKMGEHTVFINEKNEQIICNGTDKSEITTMLFSSNVKTIEKGQLTDIDKMSISILDIPASVEEITDDAIDKLCENDVINNISVSTYNENLTNYIEQKISSASDEEAQKYQAVKDALISVNNREAYLTDTTISFYNSVDNGTPTSYGESITVTSNNKTNTIKIDSLQMNLDYVKTLENKSNIAFDGFYVNNNKVNDLNGKVTLSREDVKDGIPSELKVVAKWETKTSSNMFNLFGYNNSSTYSDSIKSFSDSVFFALVNSKNLSKVFDDTYSNYVFYPESNDYDLNEDLNISKNMTLWIPYSTDFNKSNNYTKGIADFFSTGNELTYGCQFTNNQGSLKLYKETISSKGVKNLNINSKVTNSGSIILGANKFISSVKNTGATIDSFSTINVNDSLINESGYLYVHGFLIVNENSICESTSGVTYEDIVLEDWPGGNIGSLLVSGTKNKEKCAPFNQWTLPFIQGDENIKLDFSSEYYAIIFVNALESNYISTLNVVGKEGSLFNLTSESSFINKIYSNNLINLKINGNVIDNGIDFKISYIALSLATIPFPLSKMNIEILEGSNVELSANKYKVLPGSKITIAKGSTLKISSDFALYEKFERPTCESNGIYAYPNLERAYISNYGELNLIGDGAFSGDIIMNENAELSLYNDKVLKTKFIERYPKNKWSYSNDEKLLTGSYSDGTNYDYGINYTKINGIVYKNTDELKNVSGVTVTN